MSIADGDTPRLDIQPVAPEAGREESDDSHRHRLLRILFWIVVAVVVGAVLELAGVDVIGWLEDVWDNIKEISPIFILIGISFKSFESMFTALSWRCVLRAAYPSQDIKYKTVLGAYQGGVGINQIAPAKAGTWAMLGLYHLHIPGSRFATLLSAFIVQSLAFTFFGALVWVVLLLTQPESATDQFDVLGTIGSFIENHLFITLIIVVGTVFLLIFFYRLYAAKIEGLKSSYGLAARFSSIRNAISLPYSFQHLSPTRAAGSTPASSWQPSISR